MAREKQQRKPRTDGKPKGSRKTPPYGTHPGVTTTPADSEDGVGHPEVHIDEAQLYEAALTHASYAQLGRIFGVGAQTISMKYHGLVEKARAERQRELLAAQFATAITDRNPTMQIWLGKQYLGQKDVSRVEQTGADGGPMKAEVTRRVTAVIPDNGRD